MSVFRIESDFAPKGDQVKAIEDLTSSISSGDKHNVLLGITGSGKTFTMANVIQNVQRPTLILSHNKTLAAQLYSEFKTLFHLHSFSLQKTLPPSRQATLLQHFLSRKVTD